LLCFVGIGDGLVERRNIVVVAVLKMALAYDDGLNPPVLPPS
jgi:hypothetical protein